MHLADPETPHQDYLYQISTEDICLRHLTTRHRRLSVIFKAFSDARESA